MCVNTQEHVYTRTLILEDHTCVALVYYTTLQVTTAPWPVYCKVVKWPFSVSNKPCGFCGCFLTMTISWLHFSFLPLCLALWVSLFTWLTTGLHSTGNTGLTLIIMIAVWRSLGAEEGSDGGGGGSIYHGKLVCFVQRWPHEVGWQDFTIQFSYK